MHTARLVSYTQPTEDLFEEGINTPEHLIAFKARVSNPDNQYNNNFMGLIKYLIARKEWSPLEMVDATLEITTTRDIGRQILRHRSFSFQEFSQRYAGTSMTTNISRARMQDTENRQNAVPSDDPDVVAFWNMAQAEIIGTARALYNRALDFGIAKEVARAILPEGLTITRMYMKGSVRSWMHYIQLRKGPETQKEHRDLAADCEEALSTVFPTLFPLSTNNEK